MSFFQQTPRPRVILHIRAQPLRKHGQEHSVCMREGGVQGAGLGVWLCNREGSKESAMRASRELRGPTLRQTSTDTRVGQTRLDFVDQAL